MPRIARVVVLNHPHHVTQRGTNKAEIFIDDEDRKRFLQYLKDFTDKTNTRILAYCLMDNHFHLLLVPEKEGGLGKCLHGATFRYAQYFNQKHNRSGRLWQNRYFSCPIDKDEYLWYTAKYIEENPVRAGLVEKAEDWEWSSARVHIKGVRDDTLNISDWLDKEEREKYIRFKIEKGKQNEIRKATSTGRPLGSAGFYERLQKLLKRDLLPKKGGRPRKIREEK
jgi:putative transposase